FLTTDTDWQDGQDGLDSDIDLLSNNHLDIFLHPFLFRTTHNRSDGRIQITVQPDAEIWRFSVTDDGCGIAPENQERVFDIFKTLSGNDKNNTGIGLSIVKKLVETQGGKVTLESQLSMGTTFSFTWMAGLER
ncbi:MAG: ATP-binding protein, partial [Cyanobacteria bacterium]|nr:ATP-binding protein [Cyanobacteriota bacterium]